MAERAGPDRRYGPALRRAEQDAGWAEPDDPGYRRLAPPRRSWVRGSTTLGPVKALLLENVHPDAVRLLEEAGLEVATRSSALDEAELAAHLAGVALLGIRSKT